MEPARQLDAARSLRGTLDARAAVAARVGEWERRGTSSGASGGGAEGERQEDLLRFQLSEIDAAQLEEGEEDELRAERRRLQHAERIASGLAR